MEEMGVETEVEIEVRLGQKTVNSEDGTAWVGIFTM